MLGQKLKDAVEKRLEQQFVVVGFQAQYAARSEVVGDRD
jgi:hypothetical protein